METTIDIAKKSGPLVSDITGIHDTEVIEDSSELDDLPIPHDYDISSFGADFPVESLVNRLNRGDVIIPSFGSYSSDNGEFSGVQRNNVWTKERSDRFIESLLLGLPVPGIFLVRNKEQQLLVLDGQQRLRSLQKFYENSGNSKLYKLGNKVHLDFAGKTYETLDIGDRRRLDDSLIHATVVKQDRPTDDQSSIYDIFERLNTGGMNLYPQEIRIALYHGEFAQLLLDLNENEDWRLLYGRKSNRLKDLEMILRFFAFYYSGDVYKKPMKDFLNKYMSRNRHLTHQSKDELTDIFEKTTSMLRNSVGREAFRPEGALNAAVVESVMTGIAKRLQLGPITHCNHIKPRLQELFSDNEFIASVKTGTSEENKIITRHQLSLHSFSNIE